MNNQNNETLKDRFKRKVEDAKRSAKQAAQNACTFVRENKDEIIFLAPYVAAAGGVVVGLVKKCVVNRRTEDLIENHIYDRSAGHYWVLKRKPKQSEWAIIDQRRANGEGYYEILSSMNLLK